MLLTFLPYLKYILVVNRAMFLTNVCGQCILTVFEQRTFFGDTKEVIRIMYFEPISERATSNSFDQLSMTLVRIDVIGTFLRTNTKEFYHITRDVN